MRTTIVFEIDEIDLDRYEDLLEEFEIYKEFLKGEYDCQVSSAEMHIELTDKELDNNLRQQAESDAIEVLRDKSFR